MTANEYLDFGIHLTIKGELQGAVVAFCKAIQVDSENFKAYNNLGLVLQRLNRLAEAEAFFRRAIDLNPYDAYSYNNLGLLFHNSHRLTDAEDCLRQALRIDPNCPEIYNNLGLVLEDAVRTDEVEELYRHAITLYPCYSEAYYNLGNFYKTMKRLAEAESCLQKAIFMKPDYSDAIFSLATLYLLQGRYEQGWKSYNTLRLKKKANRTAGIPDWKGEDLTKSTVLLFYEQGFGDTIQFIRYTGKIAGDAGKVVLWVQKPLEKLIMDSFPSLTVYAGENKPPEKFDFACSFPSLPMIYDTLERDIPKNIPYIKSNSDLITIWRHRLDHLDGKKRNRKIGVFWAGNPKHHNDHNRSIPFSVLQSLFYNKTATWISLQVGDRALDVKEVNNVVVNFSEYLDDFSQTASLIENLDLVITVDSAVAHLAGALGKKTWVLLPFAPDWRWQLDREESVWYPTVRLFRQDRIGDWSAVIQRVKIALIKEKWIIK